MSREVALLFIGAFLDTAVGAGLRGLWAWLPRLGRRLRKALKRERGLASSLEDRGLAGRERGFAEALARFEGRRPPRLGTRPEPPEAEPSGWEFLKGETP